MDKEFATLVENVLKALSEFYAMRKTLPDRNSIDFDALSDEVRNRFEVLRVWRRSEADNQMVPPYVVFTNRGLLAIAEKDPKTLSELAPIASEVKCTRYGEQVLRALESCRTPVLASA